jgi:4-diphosphocytidyl-2-C-methyl-D-erythritol kinase
MVVYPNAKINIGLKVLEKRSDGFHNIETVFYPLEIHDILEIEDNLLNSEDELSSSGLALNTDAKDNLILKAVDLLKKDFEIPPLRIHIHKQIPLGAGLGGGSSDAAITLLALNDKFDLMLSEKELLEYASKIGSDCAFFIPNKPKFAFGRGNLFEDIELDLKSYHLLLVKPDIHVDTKLAYSLVKAQKATRSLALDILIPISEWKEIIDNDFELPIFSKYPQIKMIKEKMYENGALFSLMSGSGSSVYGIFKDEPRIPKEFENLFHVKLLL